MPKLLVSPSPTSVMAISALGEDAFPAFQAAFSDPLVLAMKPAAVVVENNSEKTIVGISVVWEYFDNQGRQQHRRLRSDSFSNVQKRPVALPHSKLLLTPSFILPESILQGSSFLAPVSGAEQQSAVIANSSKISAEIDLVIFDDGEVVGPDQRGYLEEISGRKTAAMTLAQEIRVAIAKQETQAFISKLASEERLFSSRDYVATWRSRYVRRLQRSGDLRSLLKELEGLPLVPSFYRKEAN